MRYSRFDERVGMYDVYQDDLPHALNADLPVPRLGDEVGGIGVPARNAGRPLPRGAKRVGRSWSPVGLVVTAEPRTGLGFIAAEHQPLARYVGIGAAAGLLVGAIKDNAFGGLVSGGLVGGLAYYVAGRQQP